MPRRAVPTRVMPKACSKNWALVSGSGTEMAMWRNLGAMGASFSCQNDLKEKLGRESWSRKLFAPLPLAGEGGGPSAQRWEGEGNHRLWNPLTRRRYRVGTLSRKRERGKNSKSRPAAARPACA